MRSNSIRRVVLKCISTWAILWVLAFKVLPEPTYAKSQQDEIKALNLSLLVEKVSPIVVNIKTIRIRNNDDSELNYFKDDGKNDGKQMEDFFQRFFGEENLEELIPPSLGSGFIIDDQGHIVTNNHVVEDAQQIKVLLYNQKELDAKVIGRDPNSDLALIKIETDITLPYADFGDYSKMKVGQWVVAIGSPFGLTQTVTAGIISAKGCAIGTGPYDDFIQTDASTNPGNSGGPLINMDGEVIGINSALVAGGQGIGFAIPINMAKDIITELMEHGDVTRGWIGVSIQNIDPDLAEYYGITGSLGVLVTDVFRNDPAESVGIKPKDIILSVNEKLMKDN